MRTIEERVYDLYGAAKAPRRRRLEHRVLVSEELSYVRLVEHDDSRWIQLPCV